MIFPIRNKIGPIKYYNFYKKYEQQSYSHKPKGLWYSYYDEWYNWIIGEEMKDYLYKYIHKIKLRKHAITNINKTNKNKLLSIRTLKDFNIFDKRYRGEGFKINWKQVAKDYGGIEICPYRQEKEFNSWYFSWDVASGCIWNINAIVKSMVLIYEKKEEKYKRVYITCNK